MNFRSRFNYAMSVIRNNSTPYIIGIALLISGLLCSLCLGSWIAALCIAAAYLIYTLCVDYTILKKMGYFPRKKVSVEVDDEEWEDEEALYQRDDDVEEEYEDENYNEDEDEFDLEEDIDEFEFEEIPEEEIEKKRAHEESNGFSDLEEEPYGISRSGYRFTAEELKEMTGETDR